MASGLAAFVLAGDIPWQNDWNLASSMALKTQKQILLVIDDPKGGC